MINKKKGPTAPVKDLDPEEAEAMLAENAPDVVVEDATEPGEGEEGEEQAPSDEEKDGIPGWATLPPGLKMPHQGVQVAFLRIPAKWTTNPSRGDRWCVCWPIGEMEERLAYSRSRGDMARSVGEMTKATIRVIDGKKADWSGEQTKPGSVAEFWNSIGPKGRQVVRNYYVRTHTVSEEEALDFFAKHYAHMTVA